MTKNDEKRLLGANLYSGGSEDFYGYDSALLAEGLPRAVALADTVWPGADTELCQCELEGYNFTELLLGALKAPAAKAVPSVIGM